MKYHLTGFGVSAVVHASVLLAVLPLMLWQDELSKVAEPQQVQLSLAQFVPAPPPPAEPPALQPLAEPPKPEPKLVEKPKPKPVDKPKPKPEPKPVDKPKPKPEPKPVEKPKPQPKPVEKVQTASQVKPQLPQQQPIATPPPQPSAPVAPRPAAPAPLAQATDNKAAEAAYRAKLQNLIASRKQYPRMAEKAEVEGSVVVAFTATRNGRISEVRVTQSSGNDWLDKAAIQAVKAVSGALPFPPEIRKSQWVFSLTINFRLDG